MTDHNNIIDLILLILCCAGIIISIVFVIVCIVGYTLITRETKYWNNNIDISDLEKINNEKFIRTGSHSAKSCK